VPKGTPYLKRIRYRTPLVKRSDIALAVVSFRPRLPRLKITSTVARRE